MNFSRRRSARREPDAGIDITSMIDATFILIIFLLISTTFKKKDHAFTLALPTASHEEIVVEVERTSVYVSKEGKLFLLSVPPGAELPEPGAEPQQGVELTPEALEERLAALVGQDPDLNISVLAETDTDYQRVIKVLSVLRAAGVVGVQLPYEYGVPGAAP